MPKYSISKYLSILCKFNNTPQKLSTLLPPQILSLHDTQKFISPTVVSNSKASDRDDFMMSFRRSFFRWPYQTTPLSTEAFSKLFNIEYDNGFIIGMTKSGHVYVTVPDARYDGSIFPAQSVINPNIGSVANDGILLYFPNFGAQVRDRIRQNPPLYNLTCVRGTCKILKSIDFNLTQRAIPYHLLKDIKRTGGLQTNNGEIIPYTLYQFDNQSLEDIEHSIKTITNLRLGACLVVVVLVGTLVFVLIVNVPSMQSIQLQEAI